jgi:anion-transporting  ArsA/GET3 family ATPase
VELISGRHPLIIVVGAGGVGKTTLAAALGVSSALAGRDTLVRTCDPSLRLKDALGVGEEARDREVEVDLAAARAGVAAGPGPEAPAPGRLDASLLDAGRTFDRLVERYAPDAAARDRILGNRFYRHLSGTLGGILEYMAVERLFEVAAEGRYAQVVLDTPPTRQALDFLEAPERIVGFLDSGALKLALKPWFDEHGRLRAASRLGRLGARFERFLDDLVGLDVLRDMAEFFQAFEPLFDGFRRRATRVEELLRSRETRFVLVAGPGEERVPDALYFARRLGEAGYALGPVVVNRVHPAVGPGSGESESEPEPGTPGGGGPAEGCDPAAVDGRHLLAWLGARDRRGVEQLRGLLGADRPFAALPLLPDEPTDLPSLAALGHDLLGRLAGS